MNGFVCSNSDQANRMIMSIDFCPWGSSDNELEWFKWPYIP